MAVIHPNTGGLYLKERARRLVLDACSDDETGVINLSSVKIINKPVADELHRQTQIRDVELRGVSGDVEEMLDLVGWSREDGQDEGTKEGVARQG